MNLKIDFDSHQRSKAVTSYFTVNEPDFFSFSLAFSLAENLRTAMLFKRSQELALMVFTKKN